MPRRCSVLVATLFLIAAALWAESPGTRELSLGKEALAHRDFRAAAEHLTAATRTLDPQSEKEPLADAWLQLGIAELTGLTGLEHAADALAAFRKSAELAASPSSAWLWAATAAEKLGRQEEAADLKARALAPPPAPEPPMAPSAPELVQAKAVAPAAPPAPEPVQPKLPDPAPEPVQAAPAAAPRPEPAPPQPAAAPEKAPAAPVKPAPSAFQHFFGPKERKAPPAPPSPPAAAPPPAATSTTTTPPPAAAPAGSPAAASSTAPSSISPVKEGAAFQHLFGENRPDRPA